VCSAFSKGVSIHTQRFGDLADYLGSFGSVDIHCLAQAITPHQEILAKCRDQLGRRALQAFPARVLCVLHTRYHVGEGTKQIVFLIGQDFIDPDVAPLISALFILQRRTSVVKTGI
jgi:hypothetical protein